MGTGSGGEEPAETGGASGRATPRVRITLETGLRIGPGKIDLLEAIEAAGSISAAGRRLGMSYRRAWRLVDETGRIFRRPVVVASAGGARGGGARLTEFGRALVAAYRRIEARTARIVQEELAPFDRDFAPVDRAAREED